jgi:hypothetical protein
VCWRAALAHKKGNPIRLNSVFWGVVAILAGVIASNVLRGPGPYTRDDLIAAGDVMETISSRDAVAGTSLGIPSAPVNFVLYFNANNFKNTQKAQYADYLARHAANSQVAFFLVTAGPYKELRQMRASGDISIPLIEDTSYKIARLLRLSNKFDGSFILAGAGKVLFATGSSLAPEDLREFYERYSFGKINYQDASASRLQAAGSQFPNLRVRELWSGKEFDLSTVSRATEGSSSSSLVWVFAADCPACSLSGVFSQLADPAVPPTVTPLFSSRFPPSVLKEAAQASRLTRPLYVAETEITGFENLYFSRSLTSVTSFLVQVDDRGVITRIEPIGPFDKLQFLESTSGRDSK